MHQIFAILFQHYCVGMYFLCSFFLSTFPEILYHTYQISHISYFTNKIELENIEMFMRRVINILCVYKFCVRNQTKGIQNVKKRNHLSFAPNNIFRSNLYRFGKEVNYRKYPHKSFFR